MVEQILQCLYLIGITNNMIKMSLILSGLRLRVRLFQYYKIAMSAKCVMEKFLQKKD